MEPKQMNLITEQSSDYELLDSGEGEKLERYGDFLISRPDPQALWKKSLGESEWKKADAYFSRADEKSGLPFRSRQAKDGWRKNENVPEKWEIELAELKFIIKLSAFKHTGIFPEQLENWKWIGKTIKKAKRSVSALNLFGYTGGATLAALKAGAEVCHVDGSKAAISWAKANAEISGLAEKPVRWIMDDVLSFLKREIKRGRRYDAIIMDPPAFGHGPEGELWKIEKDFLVLLELSQKLLSDDPVFFLVNGYASGYSSIAYKNNLEEIFGKSGGSIEFGELGIKESAAKRILPCGIFSRWSSFAKATE